MEIEKDQGVKKPLHIAEIQGLYGPINIAESVLHKIWMRQDFATSRLTCESGKSLTIRNLGQWNHHEGPDFKLAELIIDGELKLGDIEIHFYAEDWLTHGHQTNPEFNNVILHVVLFPSDGVGQTISTLSGLYPETLVFLPYLERDIEEYAVEEALLSLEGRDHQERSALLQDFSIHECRQLFIEKARIRWEQKVSFMSQRLVRNGWMETCHQTLLEILGYSRNRVPMSSIAQQYPINLMASAGREAAFYFALVTEQWKLAGLRPANHPKRRLAQYLHLLSHNPQWPESLLSACDRKVILRKEMFANTRQFRKLQRLKDWQVQLARDIMAGSIGGNRLHTVICDGLLPLLAALRETEVEYFHIWFHWWGGDIPSGLKYFLRSSGVCDLREWPLSNGLIQGALLYLMENP